MDESPITERPAAHCLESFVRDSCGAISVDKTEVGEEPMEGIPMIKFYS